MDNVSYFVERCIAFLEVSKSVFMNIGNLYNLTEGMSSILDQSKGSPSSFRYPLNSTHDVF